MLHQLYFDSHGIIVIFIILMVLERMFEYFRGFFLQESLIINQNLPDFIPPRYRFYTDTWSHYIKFA